MEETNEIQPEVGQGRPNNTEVVAKAKRRTYTAAYKRRIVERGAKMTGEERGAMLRSEGLYSSHLTQWRAELMRNGQMNEQGRGPKAKPGAAEIRRLERENTRLTAKLRQAELIIAAQKKLADLLGETLPTEEEILGHVRDR